MRDLCNSDEDTKPNIEVSRPQTNGAGKRPSQQGMKLFFLKLFFFIILKMQIYR